MIFCMEKTPRKYQQALLTVMGLIFLFLVIMLNHYHPRNQGVADITHGSIRGLILGVGRTPEEGYSGRVLNNAVFAATLTSSGSKNIAKITNEPKASGSSLVSDNFSTGCRQTNMKIDKGSQKPTDKGPLPDSAHQSSSIYSC